MSIVTGDRFDAAIQIKHVRSMLTASRPVHTKSDRSTPIEMTPREILGEVYAVLSLVVVIGVLAYQIVAS